MIKAVLRSKVHAQSKMWTWWSKSSYLWNNKKAVPSLGSITWLDLDKTSPHQSMTTRSRLLMPNRNPKLRNKKSPTSNSIQQQITIISQDDRWHCLNVIHSSKVYHHRGQLIWPSPGQVAKGTNLNIYSATRCEYQVYYPHQWQTMRWNLTQ